MLIILIKIKNINNKRNAEIFNKEVEKAADYSLLMDIGENNERRAPEEVQSVENIQQIMNKIEPENNLYEIWDLFLKNLDFSVLVSKKEDKEELEFMDLINVFIYTSKNRGTYEWLNETMKIASTKMLEKMDNNKRKIIKLVKKGFLFDKPSYDIKLKELKESVIGKDFFFSFV